MGDTLTMSGNSNLVAFSKRLNTVCDDKGLPERGRARMMGEKFRVSREAARKWLQGEAYPDMAVRIEICEWGNVNDPWLTRGVGDKHPRHSKLSEHQQQVVDLMAGMSVKQQVLAVRLVEQLLDNDPDAPALATGSGRSTALRVHEKKPH